MSGVLEKETTVRKADAPSRAQRLLVENDVLFQTVRPYQKNNYLFTVEKSLPTVASTGYAQLRTLNNAYFLYQLINSQTFIDNVLVRCTGSSYPAINSNDMKEIEISFPTITEQGKIADFLSRIDIRIERQQKMIDALKLYKRGVLQQIFKVNKTEHEENNIGSLFTVTRGYVLPVSELREQPDNEYCYPVYSSQTKNEGLMGYYNQYLYEDAITWTTDGANAGYVRFRKGKFYCTNVCGVLISDAGFANAYIAERLNSVTKRHVSYVGNPKLMNNVMAEITIDYPSVEMQKKYSLLISQIDEKIKYESLAVETLIKFKTALLQQMFI